MTTQTALDVDDLMSLWANPPADDAAALDAVPRWSPTSWVSSRRWVRRRRGRRTGLSGRPPAEIADSLALSTRTLT